MPKSKKSEPKFEAALARLEEIVKEMESGKLSLDDCMKRFEEGNELAGFCTKKLRDTQKKVEILLKKAGRDEWQEFEDTDAG